MGLFDGEMGSDRSPVNRRVVHAIVADALSEGKGERVILYRLQEAFGSEAARLIDLTATDLGDLSEEFGDPSEIFAYRRFDLRM